MKKTKNEVPVTRALIYCRVSSAGQRTEGHGLESQEQRCREFAKTKGLMVEGVFLDTITGNSGYEEREAMSRLIKYLDDHAGTRYAVIFDDIKRLARNIEHHINLRAELEIRRVVPLSPNFNFDGSIEGEYVERIFAATADLERKQNARQVRQKTEALIRSGFYAFNVPRGYKRAINSVGQVCLVPNEPDFSIMKEAIEGFASRRFQTKKAVYKFLLEKNFNKGRVREEYANNLLTNSLYAGFFTYEKWDIVMQPIRIETLISLETFQKIQEILKGRETTFQRKDIREEYPLRGFLLCSTCKVTMTASAPTKKKGYSRPYYHCKNPKCERFGKMRGTTTEMVHREFEKLMSSFEAKDIVMDMARKQFEEQWSKRSEVFEETRKKSLHQLEEIQGKIYVLTDRISRTTSESLIEIYEKQLNLLHYEQKALESNSVHEDTMEDFGTALNEVLGFFRSPYEYYRSGDVYDKRLAFELMFTEKIPFHHEEGFGTANYSDVVKVFQQIATEHPVGCAYRDSNSN
jgi:site-specific DNA recombinase